MAAAAEKKWSVPDFEQGTLVAVSAHVRRRILLAVVPNLEPRFRRILDGCELEFVHTLVDAQQALRSDKYDMIVVGVLFDESRMFDLLRFVRTEETHRTTPIVCVRSQLAISSRAILESLEIAVKALSANAFLDLQNFPDDADGNARLRRILDKLMEIDGDMQSGLKR